VGRSPFSFFPDGGAKKTVSHNSYTATTEFFVDYVEAHPRPKGWGPQLRADFTRTWNSADPVAIIGDTPMSGEAPVEIVAPPTKATVLSVRGSLLETDDGTPWGMGASARYLFAGAKNDASPFNGYARLRLELWAYYFFNKTPTNTRLGVAPYVDMHISEQMPGLDKRDDTEFGILVQLRIGTVLREY
jgi:hypothetical protein